jgi:hypothetical protein
MHPELPVLRRQDGVLNEAQNTIQISDEQWDDGHFSARTKLTIEKII